VVLVGTERHLQAVETAAETVKAARHPGLDTVAALFFWPRFAGAVHVTACVSVTVVPASIVDMMVVVVSLCDHQYPVD
jgi:hypothetical protein